MRYLSILSLIPIFLLLLSAGGCASDSSPQSQTGTRVERDRSIPKPRSYSNTMKPMRTNAENSNSSRLSDF